MPREHISTCTSTWAQSLEAVLPISDGSTVTSPLSDLGSRSNIPLLGYFCHHCRLDSAPNPNRNLDFFHQHTDTIPLYTPFAMSTIVAQIHIDTSSGGQKRLPITPIPFTDNASSTHLAPSTQLHIHATSTSTNTQGTNKPQQLSDLADAIETARSNLNRVLTSWKDWAGKEDAIATRSSSLKKGADDEQDEEEDQDDEDE